ncbi:MAG: hypothetical protein ACXW1S_06445, partial [Acidimicrobiia bacterium]
TYRRAPSTRRAVAVGILAGAAFSVKSLLVVPALVTAGVVIVSRRRRADIVTVPIVAAVIVIVASLPWGVTRVLDQSVLYHTDAATRRAPLHNLEVIARTLIARDLPIVVAGIVAVAAWLWHRSHRVGDGDSTVGLAPVGGWTDRLGAGRTPIIVWALLVGGLLLGENPLWRSHVSHLVPPLALLIATACVRWRTLVIAAAIALPIWSVAMRPLLWPSGPDAAETAIGRAIRSLPPGAMVISDTPGIVWRNGHRPPDRFVDTSILRITSPRPDLSITEDDVVRDATSPRVCGVVRSSQKRFGSFTDLGPRLLREGYERRFSEPRSPQTLWIKAPCRPRGPPPPAWPERRGGRTSGVVGTDRSPD